MFGNLGGKSLWFSLNTLLSAPLLALKPIRKNLCVKKYPYSGYYKENGTKEDYLMALKDASVCVPIVSRGVELHLPTIEIQQPVNGSVCRSNAREPRRE